MILKRDFQARGQATMDRVVPDALQRVCNETHDKPPAALAKALEADQMKSIAFPGGSLMGNWQRGERIAQGGRGLTWSDKPGAPNDGSCYNCHQLSPRESSFGTIGPSLYRFGASRGSDPTATVSRRTSRIHRSPSRCRGSRRTDGFRGWSWMRARCAGCGRTRVTTTSIPSLLWKSSSAMRTRSDYSTR